MLGFLRTVFAVAALALLAALSVPDAGHASPQKWTCNCTISPDQPIETCTCPGPYSYDIARSGTKRFWANCTFRSNNRSVTIVLPKLEVIEKDSHVTCTVVSYPTKNGGYAKKSCTNWGGKHKNPVQFKILCGTCRSNACPAAMTNF